MSTGISYITTGSNLVVYVDGTPHTVPLSHDRIREIYKAIDAEDVDTLTDILDLKRKLHVMSEGNIAFDGVNLEYKGNPLDHSIINRITQLNDIGASVVRHLRFLDNLMDNPSYRAVNETYRFLEACDLPLTKDGHFLAYKIVQDNYRDIYSGKFDNSVGSVPEVPRNSVDEDSTRTCSYGLHVCSRGYLGNYGTARGSRIMIVKVNPRDVVAVPHDYNNAKMRVCRYEVFDEIPYDEVFDNDPMESYSTDRYSEDDFEDDSEEPENDFDLFDGEEDHHEWDDIGCLDSEDEDDEPVRRKVVNGKLSEHQVREIKRLLADGELSKVNIGRLFDVNESTIRKIETGETWSHVSL